MKTILSFLIALLTFGMNAQNPTFNWAKQLGALGSNAYCYSTKTDNNGNVITVGLFNNTIDFDPGPGVFNMTSIASSWDIFILKLDANGDFVWAKQIGGSSQNDGVSELYTDASGNAYFTGKFGNTVDFDPGPNILNYTANGDDFYMVKLDANGNLGWAKVLSTPNSDYGQDICVDLSGNVYITGRVVGNADVDPGPGVTILNFSNAGTLLLKLDNGGNFIWAKKIDGGSGAQVLARAIINDANGNIYLAGDYFGNIDFDPGPGTSTVVPGGPNYYDGFIEKFDGLGNFAWAASINGNLGTKVIYDIQIDANNDLYAVGLFSNTVDFQSGPGTSTLSGLGNYDAFLLKYSSVGNFNYVKQFGGTGTEVALEISKDNYHNIFIGGYFNGTVDFDPNPSTNFLSASSLNAFIVKLDTASNFNWAVQFGGSSTDVPMSISVDQNSNIYTAGYFNSISGNFDTGPGTYTMSALGTYDGFIHKINYCGAPANPIDVTLPAQLGICAQNSTTLSVSGSGNFNWFSSATSTTSIGTGANYLTPTLSVGVYTYYVNAQTCTTSPMRTAITVTVDNPPLISLSSSSVLICAGVTVAISASGASTYSWNTGSTNSVIVVMPVLSTVFIVTGYNGSCASTASIVQNVAWCSGIEEFENDVKVNISPNPSSGLVIINSEAGIKSYRIWDVNGKIIKQGNSERSSSLKLNLVDLDKSIYFIQLDLENGQSVIRKLIIQK